MTTGPATLTDILDTILDIALDSLDVTRTGHPEPDRVLVSHGPPVVDVCPGSGLLAAYLGPISDLQGGQSKGRFQGGLREVVPNVQVNVELWRCVPTVDDRGRPPSPTALTDSAHDLATDAWCLDTAFYAAWLAGDLNPDDTVGSRSVTLGDLTPIAPSGGAAGWLKRVTYLLDFGPPGTIPS